MEASTVENVDCHIREKYGSCEGLPFCSVHEGKRYCVLHLPTENKESEFKDALNQKLKGRDFNF